MTPEDALKIVDKAVCELREFFPHVQILATWEDENTPFGTFDVFRGKGNWYARVGMAKEFLTRDEGQTTAKEIGDRLDPPDPLLQT
jgi:hypothetical protein